MSAHLPARFILYRREWDATKGKWQKIPCDQHGMKIDPHDPTRWQPYDAAAAHATWDEARPAAPYGVGFVLNGDGWFFYDLDNCLAGDGQWQPWASAIFQSFAGALGEVSTSGNGLHVLGRCVPEQLSNRRNKWGKKEGQEQEFYTTGRFVALSPGGLQPIGGAYHDVDWTQHLARVVPIREDLGALPDGRDPAYTGPDDDDRLIEMMLRSGGTAAAFGERATVKHLWEADTAALTKYFPDEGGTGFDHSSADMALMSHLAFWTGKDMPRMDRLFRRSGLMREKYEKRQDYQLSTVQSAARLCTKVFDSPPTPRQTAAEAGDGPGAVGYVTLQEMVNHFEGCIYIRDRHMVLVPDGALLSPQQFKATFGGFVFPRMPDGTKATTNAFEAFTESGIHRFPKANKSVFYPDQPFGAVIEGGVNTYKQPDTVAEPGDVSPFFNWLERLLPDADDRAILMAWCIDVVQNPGRKMLWAPVIQGAEGNGKSFIFEALMYAVGVDFSHVPRAKELNSTFNGWQHCKLLIHVPEVHMGGRRELLDDLKPNITDYRMPIRHMQATEVNRHCPTNWCFTTNHKDAVLKSKSDRRYAIFFAAQQSRADVERDFPGHFFPDLWDWARSGGFAALTHWWRTAEADARYSPMKGCVRAPRTSSTDEAIAASSGGIEAEIVEAIEAETVGFRGGWISTAALERLVEARRMPRLPRPKMAQILGDMGYHQWGRAPRPIAQEMLQRPKLWYRGDDQPRFESYLEAQGAGYS